MAYLEESLPLAASASEKARSEGIIYPVLLETRRILQHPLPPVETILGILVWAIEQSN